MYLSSRKKRVSNGCLHKEGDSNLAYHHLYTHFQALLPVKARSDDPKTHPFFAICVWTLYCVLPVCSMLQKKSPNLRG